MPENVKCILSVTEADVMIGSYLHKLISEGISPENITIISADCDMLVYGYGCLYQDGKEMIDTTRFW